MTATGFIVNGQAEQACGLTVQNWRDNLALRLKIPGDGRPRDTRWVRGIMLHTTKGLWPQGVEPGLGPVADDAAKVNRYWSGSTKAAGAHIVLDRDGDVGCLADLLLEATYHGNSTNDVNIGIEIFQESDRDLYRGQLDALVRMVDWITWRFRIQRQVQQLPYQGSPIPRIGNGARDVVGIYGHRDASSNRGRGDPGDHAIQWLLDASYEAVDWRVSSDLSRWKARQQLAVAAGAVTLAIDGIPGPASCAAFERYLGKPRGLWVTRPTDMI
jgi:hypothetical protein